MMMARQSIQPTYDSRETGPRYHVTTTVDDRPVTWRESITDPFVRHTVTLGWRDLLRGVLRRRLTVIVTVGADNDMVDDVLELDANALIPGSTRGAEFQRGIHQAMASFLPEELGPEAN
jgi:hypothetical protein